MNINDYDTINVEYQTLANRFQVSIFSLNLLFAQISRGSSRNSAARRVFPINRSQLSVPTLSEHFVCSLQ